MVKHRHILIMTVKLLGYMKEPSESQSTKISKMSYMLSDNKIIFGCIVN